MAEARAVPYPLQIFRVSGGGTFSLFPPGDATASTYCSGCSMLATRDVIPENNRTDFATKRVLSNEETHKSRLIKIELTFQGTKPMLIPGLDTSRC